MTDHAVQRLADRYISADGSGPRPPGQSRSQRDKDIMTVTNFLAWAPDKQQWGGVFSQTALLAFARIVGKSRREIVEVARGGK